MRRPRRAPRLDPSKPCDIWPGGVNGEGYGVVRRGRRVVSAHRDRWETEVGPIPPGAQLHHTCREKLCRELAHLVLCRDRAEHVRLHAREATHCGKGLHERTPENRRRRRDRAWECGACELERLGRPA